MRSSLCRPALAGLLAAAACTPRPAAPPSVLLVTLDTVRADHLSLYGYGVRTSPQLEALARQATVYSRALAAAPWTVPTHASLFTGRHPFEHGAHTVEVTEPVENVRPLDGRHPTLAEHLRGRGYATGAFVTNTGYLDSRWGLGRGFETYHVQGGYAAELNPVVLRWVESLGRRPFFAFVNYMDAHRPYNARERPGLLPRPVAPDGGALVEELYQRVLPAVGPPPADLVQKVADQYDTGVAHADAGLGALLDGLRSRGRFEDALVVVTSDHGEYLGEHALVEHSKDVYQEALWVPLVVKRPGQKTGSRDEAVVSSVDVPRLVTDVVSPGASPFPYRPGSHPVIAENEFTRTKDLFGKPWSSRFWRVRTALFEWPVKYIRSSDGADELYRLDRDPGEAQDLAAGEAGRLGAMRERLARFEEGRRWTGTSPAAQPDAELSERLKALGYADGGR